MMTCLAVPQNHVKKYVSVEITKLHIAVTDGKAGGKKPPARMRVSAVGSRVGNLWERKVKHV